MKLYNSIGPNPHVVRIFMAEKGITLETQDIDIRGGEGREDAYLQVNPDGQLPALVLDDGTVITEITAICEYLDEAFPGGNLIGTTPEERAQTRRWTRWVDLNICEPGTNGFRYAEGLPMFKDRFRCLPEAADGLKAKAQDKLAHLETQIEGRDYIAGDHITLADILLFGFINFFNMVNQPLNPDFKNLNAWFERMQKRESAQA